MAKEMNHWCVVCGKGYHACDTCDEIKSFTPWRALTDTPEHYLIFSALKQFNNKLIGKDEARNTLAKLDLSDRETFKESAKKVLDEIYKDDVVARKVLRKKAVETDNEDENKETTEIQETGAEE